MYASDLVRYCRASADVSASFPYFNFCSPQLQQASLLNTSFDYALNLTSVSTIAGSAVNVRTGFHGQLQLDAAATWR